MAPERARPFYASLVDRFGNAYNTYAIKGLTYGRPVRGSAVRLVLSEDGVFGAKMKRERETDQERREAGEEGRRGSSSTVEDTTVAIGEGLESNG
ncbi:D-aminoacyl-tRNA deacylase [Senna tora]|uniref:D-aminoacyl-tRNA deacylase n=1 Tax=Senna tora TaxID=362788 RepID=A0A834STQ7_9FABA|nr:D-aminoacyl-tRNA deacylase [Senna tora]